MFLPVRPYIKCTLSFHYKRLSNVHTKNGRGRPLVTEGFHDLELVINCNGDVVVILS